MLTVLFIVDGSIYHWLYCLLLTVSFILNNPVDCTVKSIVGSVVDDINDGIVDSIVDIFVDDIVDKIGTGVLP